MPGQMKQELLRKIPSVSSLLDSPTAQRWLAEHPRGLVTECLRGAVEELRNLVLADEAGRCGPMHVGEDFVLEMAHRRLEEATRPHLAGAINATGIILHTGLGRAVFPGGVVDSMIAELKGYVTLAVDRETGQRSDRDRRVEYILQELTGAQAATVVNNNAAATMIVLAALAAGKEVIVSRGQLIEIGGSFRLPDVMAQSGARLVEVGTTNRTHLKDYEQAVTENTALIMRCHPSNYRIVGFTAEPSLAEMAELAHRCGLLMLDDLGAGALLDLCQFGLEHEPTMGESIAAGADVVIASADKLIGASQGGVIVGGKAAIERIRKHPLARALRVDKTCLMVLERTLQLFRDPQRLARENPTYRMLTTPVDVLSARAAALAGAIRQAVPRAQATVMDAVGFLGSGSLPMKELASRAVAVSVPGLKPSELARRLRMDPAAVFTRLENDQVLLDVRTVTDEQVPAIAAAFARAAS